MNILRAQILVSEYYSYSMEPELLDKWMISLSEKVQNGRFVLGDGGRKTKRYSKGAKSKIIEVTFKLPLTYSLPKPNLGKPKWEKNNDRNHP